ncbi:unnamed protein product [Rhizophagus irregularis]|nr:unnamed protein product [Rhizophagus irregularis]
MVNFRGQDEESTNKNTELEEQEEDNEIPKKTNVKKFKEQIKTPISNLRIYFAVEDHEIFRIWKILELFGFSTIFDVDFHVDF